MKNFVKKFIKPQYCPYCEQPIDDKTLIKEPKKFLATKEAKSFCPHCHKQVEKAFLPKPFFLGMFLMMIIIPQGQAWFRSSNNADEFLINLVGILLNCLIVLPIIMFGLVNAPYIRSKN